MDFGEIWWTLEKFSEIWKNLEKFSEICKFFENFVVLWNCSIFLIFFNFLLFISLDYIWTISDLWWNSEKFGEKLRKFVSFFENLKILSNCSSFLNFFPNFSNMVCTRPSEIFWKSRCQCALNFFGQNVSAHVISGHLLAI